MKKFLIVLLACLAFLLFQACFCNDLMWFITGVSPMASDYTGQWHSDVACEDNEDELIVGSGPDWRMTAGSTGHLFP